MNENPKFQHVKPEELKLSTSKLTDLLKAEMEGKRKNGRSLREEVTAYEKAEKEADDAQDYKERIGDRAEREWAARELELFSSDVFTFFEKLLKQQAIVASKYLDITEDTSEHQLQIFRDDAGYRANFKMGENHIDLIFYRDRDNSIYIKQHMGINKGTRKLPEEATPTQGKHDFAGVNLLYLRDELFALSQILEADSDFATDISFLSE